MKNRAHPHKTVRSGYCANTGRFALTLLQCIYRMADWKQITARIRRARTSKEPAAQLTNLYEKTRDAMVAFELAKFFETTGQNADASRWYATAAERFRRSDWKVKAQEAAVRLGNEPPITDPIAPSDPPAVDKSMQTPGASARQSRSSEQDAEMLESAMAISSEAQEATESVAAPATSAEKKPRRRGRRGGRNRRKSAAPGVPAAASGNLAPGMESDAGPVARRGLPSTLYSEVSEPAPPRESTRRTVPQLPTEAALGDPVGPTVKGRYGDPGLSSRLNLMEMQLRRLMTCTPVGLSEANAAPAGPGVFVLTDSDLTSYYYVEACQTLRIAVANLLRGGTSRRGSDSIKPQLAEHLGIPEARVPKYLADHCVVRWLQLDEGASHFAHYVVAVLRPTLNE
jgi:hypothetical protein